jgi:hypothetical protein
MMFREIIGIYSENHMELINLLCGQNAELLKPEFLHVFTDVL